MPLGAELRSTIHQFLSTSWSRSEGRVVPAPEAIGLGNEGIELKDAVCLYADLAESTDLTNRFADWFAATVYKGFLRCATRIILEEAGSVTSFDGDRVMAVYLGNDARDRAVRTALKLKSAVSDILTPAIRAKWPLEASVQGLQVLHTVGIDVSKIFATRTGVRGNNDIVWVGRAANQAAKLSAFREPRFPTLITEDVLNGLSPNWRSTNGQSMWELYPRRIGSSAVYSSTWGVRLEV